MKIDERHLVQLAAVVQAGGVTEGAAMLGLTQPAVSRTLSMLEKRLGEPLFLKGRRPLQPTPLGRALADHGQAMLAASRKASQLVDSFRQGQSGVVRVGGTPFFMDALISGMIADFQRSQSDIRIDQSYGYLPELRAALHADRIDLAICPIDILDEGSGLTFQRNSSRPKRGGMPRRSSPAGAPEGVTAANARLPVDRAATGQPAP